MALQVLFPLFSAVGMFTLFAPTNEAFDNVPESAGSIPLRELLKYHVARGLIYADDITNEFLARSLLAKRDIRLNIYKVDYQYDLPLVTLYSNLEFIQITEWRSCHCKWESYHSCRLQSTQWSTSRH